MLGIVARVDSLDRKLLWGDEAYSLLRIAGHTDAEFYALFDGRTHAASDVVAMQRVTPQRGVGATLASIRAEEPQRGPLYYALARLWIGVAGNGTAAVRSFSVALGIAGIGLAFLFGRAAWGVLGGAVFAALVALSPLQIRFAQQVREYVLVADGTLLCGWLALRAAQRPTVARWTAFAIAGAAGLYVNVEFAFALVAQSIAVVVCMPRSRTVVAGALGSLVLAALAYAPWALAVAHAAWRGSQGVAWAATSYGLRPTALKWIFNTGANFFDSEYARPSLVVVLLPLVAFAVFGTFAAFGAGRTGVGRTGVRRNGFDRDGGERATVRSAGADSAPSAARVGGFVAVATALSTALPLVALDVVRHAHYALVARYLMPTWIGVLALAATAIVAALRAPQPRARVVGVAAFAYACACGAAAFVLDRPHVEWWDDNEHLSEIAVADVVRASPAPIVAEGNAGTNVLVLSRYLSPAQPLVLVADTAKLRPAPGKAYLFVPSRALRAAYASRAVSDISPALDLAIPDLRGATDDPLVASNALWRVAH